MSLDVRSADEAAEGSGGAGEEAGEAAGGGVEMMGQENDGGAHAEEASVGTHAGEVAGGSKVADDGKSEAAADAVPPALTQQGSEEDDTTGPRKGKKKKHGTRASGTGVGNVGKAEDETTKEEEEGLDPAAAQAARLEKQEKEWDKYEERKRVEGLEVIPTVYHVYDIGDQVYAHMWMRPGPYTKGELAAPLRASGGSNSIGSAMSALGENHTPVDGEEHPLDGDKTLVLSEAFYRGTVLEVILPPGVEEEEEEENDNENDKTKRHAASPTPGQEEHDDDPVSPTASSPPPGSPLESPSSPSGRHHSPGSKDDEEEEETDIVGAAEEKEGETAVDREPNPLLRMHQPTTSRSRTYRKYIISFEEEPVLTDDQKGHSRFVPADIRTAARRPQTVGVEHLFGSQCAPWGRPTKSHGKSISEVPDLAESNSFLCLSVLSGLSGPAGHKPSLTADGKWLIFETQDCKFMRMCTRTGEACVFFTVPDRDADGSVLGNFSHALTPEGRLVILTSKDKLLIYDTFTTECVLECSAHLSGTEEVDDAKPRSKGKKRYKHKSDQRPEHSHRRVIEPMPPLPLGGWGLFLQSRDGQFAVLDSSTGELLASGTGSDDLAAEREDGQSTDTLGERVAVMFGHGERWSTYIHVLEARTGATVRTIPFRSTRVIRWMAMSPDGSKMVTLSHRFKAQVWAVDTGERLFELEYAGGKSCGVMAPASLCSTNSNTVITAHDDGTLQQWDLETRSICRTLDAGEPNSLTFDVARDASVVACRTEDSVFRVWEPPHASLFHSVKGYHTDVIAVSAPGCLARGVVAPSRDSLRPLDIAAQRAHAAVRMPIPSGSSKDHPRFLALAPDASFALYRPMLAETPDGADADTSNSAQTPQTSADDAVSRARRASRGIARPQSPEAAVTIAAAAEETTDKKSRKKKKRKTRSKDDGRTRKLKEAIMPRKLVLIRLPSNWIRTAAAAAAGTLSVEDTGGDQPASAKSERKRDDATEGKDKASLINAPKGTAVVEIELPAGRAVNCAAISADLGLIAVAMRRDVHILADNDIADVYSVVATVSVANTRSVRRLRFSPNGGQYLLADMETRSQLWRLHHDAAAQAEPRYAFEPVQLPGRALAHVHDESKDTDDDPEVDGTFRGTGVFSMDGSLLAVAESRTMQVYQLPTAPGTPALVTEWKTDHSQRGMAVSACGTRLVVFQRSLLVVFAIRTGEVLFRVAYRDLPIEGIDSSVSSRATLTSFPDHVMMVFPGGSSLYAAIVDQRSLKDSALLHTMKETATLFERGPQDYGTTLVEQVQHKPTMLLSRNFAAEANLVELLMENNCLELLSNILPSADGSGGGGGSSAGGGVVATVSPSQLAIVKAMLSRSAYRTAIARGATSLLLRAWSCGLGGFIAAQPLDHKGTVRGAWDRSITVDLLCDLFDREPRKVQLFLKELSLAGSGTMLENGTMLPETEVRRRLDGYSDPSSTWGRETQVPGGVPVEVVRVPIPGVAEGTKLLEKAVKSCALTRRYDVFESEPLRVIVDTMWDASVGAMFRRDLALYLSLIVCFTLSGLTFPLNADTDSAVVNIARFLPLIATLLLWGYFVHHEHLQLISGARESELNPGLTSWNAVKDLGRLVAEHFSDIWNAVDFFMLVLVPLCVCLQCFEFATDPSGNFAASSAAVAVTSPFLFYNLLFYLQGSQASGILIRMVIQISLGIGYFLLILAVVIVSFTISFFVLSRSGRGMPEYTSFSRSFLSVFTLMLGDFEIESFEESSSFFFTAALFVLFMFFVAVVLLNLLIAIMGDKYDEVQENAVAEWRYALANIVLEYDRINQFKRRSETSSYYAILVARPAGASTAEGGGDHASWGGRVRSIKQEILRKTAKRFDKQDSELQQMRLLLASMQRSMRDLSSQLQHKQQQHQQPQEDASEQELEQAAGAHGLEQQQDSEAAPDTTAPATLVASPGSPSVDASVSFSLS